MEFKILIADDEPDLREMVRYNLEAEGYQVVTASDGVEAVEVAMALRPHLIVLDVRMPNQTGLEACRRIRGTSEISSTPIIMLTALGQEHDEIGGLEAGADDYIRKPISPRVLVSRIKAMLRRVYPPDKAPKKVLVRDGLEIDRERYIVRMTAGQTIQKLHLPRKQFELLYRLAMNPGIVHSREDLLDTIWGSDVYVTPRTVDVHVRKIRDAIGDEHIETVKGVGYRFKE